MLKSKWGDPAYVGKTLPLKITNKIILVIAIILVAGFIKAGLREGWFKPIIDFFIH